MLRINLHTNEMRVVHFSYGRLGEHVLRHIVTRATPLGVEIDKDEFSLTLGLGHGLRPCAMLKMYAIVFQRLTCPGLLPATQGNQQEQCRKQDTCHLVSHHSLHEKHDSKS